MRRLRHTELDVFELNLGGNVFGWTADEAASFAVLDAYAEAGGNFIDTSDSYMATAPGNSGGESETIIGNWMAARGNRRDMVIATKVSHHPQRPGLAPGNIKAAVQDSLQRLQTDYLDLYYAHYDDPDTELADTLGAFDELIRAGTVRYLAASNYTPERLGQALEVSRRNNLTGFVALQPHYNLLERRGYEQNYAPLATEQELSVLPYYGLASGYLTGKYDEAAGSQRSDDPRRAGSAGQYDTEQGRAVVRVLRKVAAAHGVAPAAVALAWLAGRPGVAAPIASARNPEQLRQLLPAAQLQLTEQQTAELDEVSAGSAGPQA